MDFSFRFDGDRLRTPGINWGYGDSDPHLVGRTPHFMVIRKAGNKDWSGLGQSDYYPTTYTLCSYKTDVRPGFDREGRFMAEELEQVEPGRKWRSEKERLLKKMTELEGKLKPTKKIKWVPRSHTTFWPTRAPLTTWYCCPEKEKANQFGYYKITCGKRHTTKLGAERHCKKLNADG